MANDANGIFFKFMPLHIEGHEFTCRGQVWWNSDFEKLTTYCLIFRTKDPGCAGHVRAPMSATYLQWQTNTKTISKTVLDRDIVTMEY